MINLFDVTNFLWQIDRLATYPTLENVFALTDSLVIKYPKQAVEKFEGKIQANLQFQSFWQEYQKPDSKLHKPFDQSYLAALPTNTLGYNLYQFWQQNNISPDNFKFIPEKNLIAVTRNRLMKIHDIWHVLADFEMTPIGEYGLQAFYLGQQISLSSFAIMSAGFWRVLKNRNEKEIRPLMESICRGYLTGRNAKTLTYLIWEDLWQEDLEQLREKLNIKPYFQII